MGQVREIAQVQGQRSVAIAGGTLRTARYECKAKHYEQPNGAETIPKQLLHRLLLLLNIDKTIERDMPHCPLSLHLYWSFISRQAHLCQEHPLQCFFLCPDRKSSLP